MDTFEPKKYLKKAEARKNLLEAKELEANELIDKFEAKGLMKFEAKRVEKNDIHIDIDLKAKELIDELAKELIDKFKARELIDKLKEKEIHKLARELIDELVKAKELKARELMDKTWIIYAFAREEYYKRAKELEANGIKMLKEDIKIKFHKDLTELLVLINQEEIHEELKEELKEKKKAVQLLDDFIAVKKEKDDYSMLKRMHKVAKAAQAAEKRKAEGKEPPVWRGLLLTVEKKYEPMKEFMKEELMGLLEKHKQ